jgi:hypothetical protein
MIKMKIDKNNYATSLVYIVEDAKNSFNSKREPEQDSFLVHDIIETDGLKLNSVFKEEASDQEMQICNNYINCVINNNIKDVHLNKQIELLAINGITEAEYALGFKEFKLNKTKIINYGLSDFTYGEQFLIKAAQKGHVKAQATLAEMYYWGKEIEKAIPWAMSASNMNNLDATQILAWCYHKRNCKKDYINEIKKAAELQEVYKEGKSYWPTMEYGKVLWEGMFVDKNLNEAIGWFNITIDLTNDWDIKSEAIYY